MLDISQLVEEIRGNIFYFINAIFIF